MNARRVILGCLTLAAGAVGGYFVGYFRSKHKYQDMADKEIASIRKVYEKHFGASQHSNEGAEVPNTPSHHDETPVKTDFDRVDAEVKSAYSNYAKMYKKEAASPAVKTTSTIATSNKKVKSNPASKQPYVITPDQFNESDYEAQSLTWFSDKILADTDGNIIHNIDEVIGPEALSTFGRYLDDAVYVRNDLLKIDYEILWDARKYFSVYKSSKPKDMLVDGD